MALWCVICEQKFGTLPEFEDHIDFHIKNMEQTNQQPVKKEVKQTKKVTIKE